MTHLNNDVAISLFCTFMILSTGHESRPKRWNFKHRTAIESTTMTKWYHMRSDWAWVVVLSVVYSYRHIQSVRCTTGRLKVSRVSGVQYCNRCGIARYHLAWVSAGTSWRALPLDRCRSSRRNFLGRHPTSCRWTHWAPRVLHVRTSIPVGSSCEVRTRWNLHMYALAGSSTTIRLILALSKFITIVILVNTNTN